jgi:hypothetical protein
MGHGSVEAHFLNQNRTEWVEGKHKGWDTWLEQMPGVCRHPLATGIVEQLLSYGD